MNGLNMLLANVTDMAGSLIIILFSFLSLRYAYLLTKKQPENFLWGFLFYFCMTLAAFAISRAMGHLVKQVLLIGGNDEQWKVIAPLAGGFNTLLMTSLAAVTIYYHKGIQGFRAIETKASHLKSTNKELKLTASQLHEMNVHLEEMVENRTREFSASEKKFRNFFMNSKDMVFFCDAKNRLVNINASGLEMLGYPFNSPPPLSLQDIFFNEEDMLNYFEEITTHSFVNDLEIEFKRKDGTIIYTLLSANAVYDEESKFTGCEGIAKGMAGLVMMLVSMAGMAIVGVVALVWLVLQPLDERILVDADTESVIWTTRYRTHTDTRRLKYADVTQVEHVTLRSGGCEVRLKRADGTYEMLQESSSSLGSEARSYGEKMGKPVVMVDNTAGFHKLGG